MQMQQKLEHRFWLMTELTLVAPACVQLDAEAHCREGGREWGEGKRGSTGQQVNRPTGQQVNKSTGQQVNKSTQDETN